MATSQERIISPGVFTRENDQSFLAQGIANIGGAIVGPFPKGPAFAPTLINTQADLEQFFGIPDGQFYGPYTAQQYLESQGTVTIVRVGALGGYNQLDPVVVYAVPGSTPREVQSGSLAGTATGVVTESIGISASLAGTFSSGYLSGSTVTVGFLSASVSGLSAVYTGSSYAVIISASLVNVPVISGPFSGSTVSGLVTSASAGTYTFTGTISGSYGTFAPTQFVASGSDKTVLAVLANTALDAGQALAGFSGSVMTAATASVIGTDYVLTLSGSTTGYGVYNFSLDAASPSYITNVFGTNPMAGLEPIPDGYKPSAAYVYKYFPRTIDTIVTAMLASGSWKIFASASDVGTSGSMTFKDGIAGGGSTSDTAGSAYDVRQAETPWINSQLMNGTRYQLFKVHTLADGTDANTDYKIVIGDVKLAGAVAGTDFGSFSLTVRAFDDTDSRPDVLENYQNLNLDPNSANYIARRIGDRYIDINYHGKVVEYGDFQNKSKIIRVEMSKAVTPDSVVPYGFDAYATPIGAAFANDVPAMMYTSASVYPSNVGKYASGVIFQEAPVGADTALAGCYPAGAKDDNKQFFAPVPVGSTTGNNVLFDLETNCGISSTLNLATEGSQSKKRKFALGFQQGFSGQSPSIPVLVGSDITAGNTQGLDCTTINSSGSVGYKQALAALGNADEFDINLLVTPGIIYSLHSYVAQLSVDTCEGRGDCFYIMDLIENQLAGGNSVTNVVDKAAEFDTNYAAAYYPWVKIVDTNTNKIVTVPPSVVLPAVFAQNDKVSAEWFAPAGLNRGGITKAVQVVDRLTHAERDELYEGRVNPIAQFPGQGIVVWGQKTLQVKASALDRINVRRLLIALKKYIASTSKYLVFEPNAAVTRNRFLSIVNPYLESVQQRNGLYSFKVVMDDTNNTPDLIDRNILVGDLYLQPTKTAEFIVLNFNVLPTGATFPTA